MIFIREISARVQRALGLHDVAQRAVDAKAHATNVRS